MKKMIAGLLLNAILPATSLAQSLTLLKANSQGWSGGAYGRGGCRYFILVKYDEKVTLDSAYINNVGYALSPNLTGNGGYNVDSVKHTYAISESESHCWVRNYNYDPDEDNYKKVIKKEPPPPPPVRHFDGKAMIVYHYKGKQGFLIIDKFTMLPSINYP